MEQKHLMYMPMTGLGLYGGHRGKRWLQNRIKIFKHFVLPSLLNQTEKNFILWVSFRYQDRGDKTVKDFVGFLKKLTDLNVVATYSGVCFWDDKYPDDEAHNRLASALRDSMGELLNAIGEGETVLMTIQPSDDVYKLTAVEEIQSFFKQNPEYGCFGYRMGYVMDYLKRRLAEWNPATTPPFYTIKFDRETFQDPHKHLEFTGPYKSHEYVKDYMKAHYSDDRGFVVGTHGENISTIFDHPFAGHEFLGTNIDLALRDFGLGNTGPIKLRTTLRRKIMRKLPYGWQRKLRFILGERFFARLYNWLRA